MRDGVQPTLCYARGWCVECQDGICNAPVSTMELGRAQLRHCPRRPERPPSLSGGLGASNSNTPPCSLPDMRSGGQNTRASIAEECAAAGGARWIHPSSQPCNSAPMFLTRHAELLQMLLTAMQPDRRPNLPAMFLTAMQQQPCNQPWTTVDTCSLLAMHLWHTHRPCEWIF